MKIKFIFLFKMVGGLDLGVLSATLIILVGPVKGMECPCDCPLGCKVFTNSFGVLSDGSGFPCVKDGFGVTGQYGFVSRSFNGHYLSVANYFNGVDFFV